MTAINLNQFGSTNEKYMSEVIGAGRPRRALAKLRAKGGAFLIGLLSN